MGSDLARVGAALKVETKGSQQFEDRTAEGTQRGLIGRPGFGMSEGLVDPSSASSRALDNSTIDEEQENGRPLVQRSPRPKIRAGEVVLKVQARVAGCLVEERLAVLIVVVRGIMDQAACPVTSQLIHE